MGTLWNGLSVVIMFITTVGGEMRHTNPLHFDDAEKFYDGILQLTKRGVRFVAYEYLLVIDVTGGY